MLLKVDLNIVLIFFFKQAIGVNFFRLGGGSGKKVMTVAGALLGASIANDNERVGYKVVNKQRNHTCS
jgi:uncharacterized protein YcfJ